MTYLIIVYGHILNTYFHTYFDEYVLILHWRIFMGIIKFINHEGKQHVVELEDGKSLMQIAMDNGVQGIDADCGGECACGTCHVMVGNQWLGLVNSAKSEELQMLEMTPERQANSRLACQIQVTNAMDGMEVHLPEFQM